VPGDGYFIAPTVIADVDSKARIFQEEIFGPVLAVTKARDFDHALAAGFNATAASVVSRRKVKVS